MKTKNQTQNMHSWTLQCRQHLKKKKKNVVQRKKVALALEAKPDQGGTSSWSQLGVSSGFCPCLSSLLKWQNYLMEQIRSI